MKPLLAMVERRISGISTSIFQPKTCRTAYETRTSAFQECEMIKKLVEEMENYEDVSGKEVNYTKLETVRLEAWGTNIKYYEYPLRQ
jgi:hypothetical protein